VRFALALMGCLLLTYSVSVAHADKRVALVIGNSAYQNAPALINPKNDAQDVGKSLRELGFSTIIATDLDRAGMNDVLDRFSRTISDAEIALVYYSGHGMQFGGRNFLLPVNARLESADDVNRFRLLPVEDVFNVLQGARGARIVILDACRNNPVEDDLKRRMASIQGANRDAFLTRGLSRVEANGLIVAYATQANDVAADGVGHNSPFATALLHNLSTPDIDLRQMLFNVQDEVDRLTGGKQRPELSISLVGQFKLKITVPARDNKEPDNKARDNKEVVTAPTLDPAAQAWAATRDTTSQAVLEEFIRQFGSTVYGSMALARLEELKKSQLAAVAPAVQPAAPEVSRAPGTGGSLSKLIPPSESPDIPQRILGPYDGIWQLTQTSNRFCTNSTVVRRLKIENNRILANRERDPGQVDSDGTFKYEDLSQNPANFKRISGKLSGTSGKGSFYTVGGRCAGTVVLQRLAN
jgi:uncharacterized caspase-like protein